jgi:hypothetical protein
MAFIWAKAITERIIVKEPIYKREQTIQEFAYIAGCPDGIRIKTKQRAKEKQQAETITQFVEPSNLTFEIIDYSEKAIALFGDTKEIKDLLKAMGGKFNPRLTHNDEKRAGWIFSKSKREELETVLKLNTNNDYGQL